MNIGGNMYQKFGVFPEASDAEIPGAPVDLGRYAVTKAPRDRRCSACRACAMWRPPALTFTMDARRRLRTP